MANLTVNVLANLSGFMSGMTQIRQVVQQTGQQLNASLMLPAAPINSLQTFRERAMQVAFAVGTISAGLTAMAGASIAAFARQEQAFAGIQKTVDATDAEFAQLRANLTALSNRAPISFSDLSRIGELAGQLGIRGVDNLTKFTDTIAKISVTTNLTAEAAATAFARIANVMQEPIENVDRMGATVVDLGNKFATTEAEITEFAQRIAGAGKIAGLTTAEVFAIGTAFSSVGVQAEAGGTAIQKMLVAMTQAVASGGEKLRVFASTAGVSAQEFQKLFRAAPAEAFTKVIEGLANAGEEAFEILGSIVGEEARFLRAMLSMANAGDLLSRAFKTAGTAWEQNLALIIESEKRFATFTSTMQTLRNVMENFAASIGEQLMPFLRPLAVGITSLITAFQALPGPVKAFLAISVSLAAVIGGIVTAIALAIAAFTALAGAVGGAVVLLKIGVWVAAAIAALALLGTAVQSTIKFFGFFSESTNELEARLRGTAGTVKQNESMWKQFGTAVSEAWMGLKVVAGEAWDSIASTISGVVSSIWTTIKGWGSALYETWVGIWTDIKNSFLELWNLIPDSVKSGVATILSLLNPLKGAMDAIGAAWGYLRERGKQALEVERQRQRELDNEMKREIARGNSLREATEKHFKAAGMSVEEFDLKLRKSQMAYQDMVNGFQISSAAIKLAVTSGVLSEEEALQASLEVLDLREQALKRQHAAELALVGSMSKYSKERAEKEDDINKRFKASSADILNTRLEVIDRITAAHVKQNQEAIELWIKEAEVAAKASLKIEEDRIALNDQLRAFGQTEFERFVKQEQDKTDAVIKARVELGGSMEEIGADIAKQMELLDRRITERLLEKLPEAERQYKGLAASVGLTGEAAFRAQQAFVLHNKAYEELDEIQRKNVDTNAKALAQLEEIAKKTEAQRLVHAALMVGYAKEITLTEAMNVASIKLRQQQLDAVLDYYTTLNTAAQKEARTQAATDQEIAQNKGDLYRFLGAATRRWVADQESVWSSFGKMITNTFDNVSRTLSDVFFNLFTGQTIKLQDVWKSMLNAMLRELANFLAAQTVRTFLAFLGNLMQGQSVGTAAGGALNGLLGGSGTGAAAGNGSTAAGVGSLVSSGLSGLSKLLGFGSGSSSTSTLSSGGSNYSLGGVSTKFDTSFLDSLDYAAYTPTFDFSGTQTGGYYMASGGRVPGSGRGDTVPAMLEPGEFVVRREVAQQLGSVLDLVNRGGAPRAQSGRLYFAEGGVVPSISGDQAIINLLYAIYQQNAIQTGALQATAQNTGATASALGEQPATSTAGVTTLSGVGGNVQAGTAPASGGGSSSGGGGGGSQSVQFNNTDAILSLLRSGTGLARSGTSLLSGLMGTGNTGTVKTLNSLLSILSGGVNLASGISSGSMLQSIGGGLSLASGVLGFPGVTSGLDSLYGSALIGSGSTALGLGGVTSSALGIAGGGLGLYSSIASIIEQGASVGNIAGALMNAYTIYAAAAPLISAATGTALPTFGSLAASAISSLSPTLAASLGIGGGVSAAGAAGTLGAGVAVTGGATAAAAGSGAAFATIGAGATLGIVAAPLLIGMVFKTLSDIEEMEVKQRQLFNAKQTMRTIIPSIIENVPKVAEQTWDVVNNPASTPQQLLDSINSATSWIQKYNEYDNYFKEGGGYGFAPPELIAIGQKLSPYLSALQVSIIRAGDRLAVEAPGLVPQGNPFLDPLTIAKTFGANATGALQPTGLTGLDMASAGAYYTQGQLPSAGLTWTPSGYHTTSILNQIQGIQPGNLEQGISQVIGLYGQMTPIAQQLGFGTAGTPLATPLTAVSPESIAQAQATADLLEQIRAQARAAEEAWYWSQMNSSPGGLQTGGWVPGRGYGDHVPMLLEPGEFVVPRQAAIRYAPWLETLRAGGSGGAGGAPASMPITISITVNGNVDDPHELAQVIAPILRDELKRIDPRYSRAGNKTQA